MKPDSDFFKDHIGGMLSHLRYAFTIQDISSVFIDGDFIEAGFCVRIDNEIKSEAVSKVIQLYFDKRGYQFGFSFNIPEQTSAILLEYNKEFTVENSHKFIDLVKNFMQTIDTRMGNDNDIELLLTKIEEGDLDLGFTDVMTLDGIADYWDTCINRKILA